MTEHELDTLLRDYGGAVRAVCRAILPGHPQDAEEAEADTFYKLWRGARLPADEAHRRRLVVQAARQCAIDRYRALLRRGETLPLDDRDDAELAVARESELETRELMAQVMALLSGYFFVLCNHCIVLFLFSKRIFKKIHVKDKLFVLLFHLNHIAYIQSHDISHYHNKNNGSNL